MLTIVMPYFENPGMLRLQYGNWLAWPGKYRNRLKVIIVDDGSPEDPASNVPRPYGLPELEIYRVLEDRPWRQNGAKNIGAHVAPDGWLLLTDMDHMVAPETASALFKAIDKGQLDEGTAYMLDRIEADTGKPTLGRDGNPKPHPNSFLMTREMYWRIGGYDEEFTGYGTDKLFRERVFKAAKRGHLDIPLTRYWRDIVPDASTTTLGRKVPEFRCDTKAVLARKATEGRQDEIKLFQLPWERVL